MRSYLIASILGLLVLAGCRGMESDRTPIQPQLNMFYQERFNAQDANPFFEDGMAMRQPVPGTVARGFLREEDDFYRGQDDAGEYVEQIPVTVTREMLLRGREQYDVYCAICHGRAGTGDGIITTGGFGYTPATDLHEERIREMADGNIYDVIANGVRAMPGYAHQISVADRWAITAYIRALQRSQRATEGDIPASVLAQIQDAQGTGVEGEVASPEVDDPEEEQLPN